MKHFIKLSLAIFLLLTMTCGLQACAHDPEQNVLTIQTADGPRVFHIELALYPKDQEQGLMNRKSMPQDAGMLFVFNDVDKRVFWMKDTLIPLDMLFIDKDGRINHIHHMARPLDETQITSLRPAKAVLEVNGGITDTLGIKEGDKIIHPVFRNQLDQ